MAEGIFMYLDWTIAYYMEEQRQTLVNGVGEKISNQFDETLNSLSLVGCL